MNQRRPHDCHADSRSRYKLRCYWDRIDVISLCLDVDAVDLAARTRNVAVRAVAAAVAGDDLWDIRVVGDNVPKAVS